MEDRVDPLAFNQVLWRGLMGAKSYPANSSGADLRENRQELLQRYFESRRSASASAAESSKQ